MKTCITCKGSGFIEGTRKYTCPTCEGLRVLSFDNDLILQAYRAGARMQPIAIYAHQTALISAHTYGQVDAAYCRVALSDDTPAIADVSIKRDLQRISRPR